MSVYWIEDHIRQKISKEIENIEVSPDWKPNEVIRYIARKIVRVDGQTFKQDQ